MVPKALHTVDGRSEDFIQGLLERVSRHVALYEEDASSTPDPLFVEIPAKRCGGCEGGDCGRAHRIRAMTEIEILLEAVSVEGHIGPVKSTSLRTEPVAVSDAQCQIVQQESVGGRDGSVLQHAPDERTRSRYATAPPPMVELRDVTLGADGQKVRINHLLHINLRCLCIMEVDNRDNIILVLENVHHRLQGHISPPPYPPTYRKVVQWAQGQVEKRKLAGRPSELVQQDACRDGDVEGVYVATHRYACDDVALLPHQLAQAIPLAAHDDGRMPGVVHRV